MSGDSRSGHFDEAGGRFEIRRGFMQNIQGDLRRQGPGFAEAGGEEFMYQYKVDIRGAAQRGHHLTKTLSNRRMQVRLTAGSQFDGIRAAL